MGLPDLRTADIRELAKEAASHGAEYLLDQRTEVGLWRTPLTSARVDYALTNLCLAVIRRLMPEMVDDVDLAARQEFAKIEDHSVNLGRDATEFVIRESLRMNRKPRFITKRIGAMSEYFGAEIGRNTQSLARHIYLLHSLQGKVPGIPPIEGLTRDLCARQDDRTGGWPVMSRQDPELVSTSAAVVALGWVDGAGEGSHSVQQARRRGAAFLNEVITSFPATVAGEADVYVLSWVLRALAACPYSSPDVWVPLVLRLRDLQNEDGGWGRPGGPSSQELTARTCLALAIVALSSERLPIAPDPLVSPVDSDDDFVRVWNRSLEMAMHPSPPFVSGSGSNLELGFDSSSDESQVEFLHTMFEVLRRVRRRGRQLVIVGTATMVLGVFFALNDVTSLIGYFATGLLGLVAITGCVISVWYQVGTDRALLARARELERRIEILDVGYDRRIRALLGLFNQIRDRFDAAQLRSVFSEAHDLIPHIPRSDVVSLGSAWARAAGMEEGQVADLSTWFAELSLLDIYSRQTVVRAIWDELG